VKEQRKTPPTFDELVNQEQPKIRKIQYKFQKKIETGLSDPTRFVQRCEV